MRENRNKKDKRWKKGKERKNKKTKRIYWWAQFEQGNELKERKMGKKSYKWKDKYRRIGNWIEKMNKKI